MTRFGCAVMLGFMFTGSAHALTAVRPIEGYICMNTKWSGNEEDLWDESKLDSVYAAPSASARKLGTVGATAIVASPLHVENGFAEILRLNGQKGWVKADRLVPFSVPKNPNAKCIPSIMSDGSIGTARVSK